MIIVDDEYMDDGLVKLPKTLYIIFALVNKNTTKTQQKHNNWISTDW